MGVSAYEYCAGDPSSVLKTPTPGRYIYNRGPLGQTQHGNGVYYYAERVGQSASLRWPPPHASASLRRRRRRRG